MNEPEEELFDGDLERRVEAERGLATKMDLERVGELTFAERLNPDLARARRRAERPARIQALREVVNDYERFRKLTGLISQAGAARVLGVSNTQLARLIAEGKLVWLEFPGLKEGGVTIASLELLRKQRAKQGLEDAARELLRLRKEEAETQTKEDKP